MITAMQNGDRINGKILSFLCLSIFILIVVFGLWPFNLNPLNHVSWLKDESGVRISGPGQLYSAGNLTGAFSDRNISLEMVLRPADEPNNRLPHILSFWDGRPQEVFLIGQWKDSPAIRVRTTDPEISQGYRERGKGKTMIKNRRIFLTLTSSPKGTILYVDGVRAEKFSGFPLFDDLPAGRSVLVIGNSATGKSWWEGDLLGLALYNRALSELEVRENYSCWVKQDYQSLSSEPGMIGLYPFKEGKGEWVRNGVAEVHSLYLPSVFHPLQKIVLEWPAKTDLKRRGFYQDMAVNILGFIPLGFLLTFWLLRFTRLRAAGAGRLTLLIGALTSLAIELAQVYLPSRSSSAGDLVFNTLGTLIGIVLLRPAMRYKKTGATVS